MASLRDLKKRLQSVRTTGKLAGAMRTAATAKYARASGRLNALSAYSSAFRELTAMAESGRASPDLPEAEPRAHIDCPSAAVVLVSGNRGLCGGYNHELFSYFTEYLKGFDAPPAVFSCGRMARDLCAEKGCIPELSFEVSDVPTYEEARRVSDALYGLYSKGRFSSVTIVYQRFVNMLKQEPSDRVFLPLAEGQGEGEPPLFIPDRETVAGELVPLCLASDMYTLLLSCASGAQAATLLAMRSAYDNANASAQLLETAINRRRQAKVTESVIETSSFRNET